MVLISSFIKQFITSLINLQIFEESFFFAKLGQMPFFKEESSCLSMMRDRFGFPFQYQGYAKICSKKCWGLIGNLFA